MITPTCHDILRVHIFVHICDLTEWDAFKTYASLTGSVTVSRSDMTTLPEDFFSILSCVREIVINNTQLSTLPHVSQQMGYITHLDLSVRVVPI